MDKRNLTATVLVAALTSIAFAGEPIPFQTESERSSFASLDRIAAADERPAEELPRGRVINVVFQKPAAERSEAPAPAVASVRQGAAAAQDAKGAVTIVPGSPVSISGAGFGDKATAPPLIYMPVNVGEPAKASELGQLQKWNGVENFEAKTVDGRATLVGKAGSGVWTLRLDRELKPGEVMYASFWLNRSFDVGTSQTNNFKIFRAWSEPGKKPNIYDAPNNGRVYVEDITGSGMYYKAPAEPKNQWMFVQIEFRPSATDKKEGFYKRYTGGDLLAAKMDTTMFATRTSKADAPIRTIFPVHQVAANMGRWKDPAWDKSNTVLVRDVYVDIASPGKGAEIRSPKDTAVPRVIVTDAKTMSASKKFDVLPVKAWKDGRVDVQMVLPNFKAGDNAFLHIVNDHNRWSDPVPFKVGAR